MLRAEVLRAEARLRPHRRVTTRRYTTAMFRQLGFLLLPVTVAALLGSTIVVAVSGTPGSNCCLTRRRSPLKRRPQQHQARHCTNQLTQAVRSCDFPRRRPCPKQHCRRPGNPSRQRVACRAWRSYRSDLRPLQEPPQLAGPAPSLAAVPPDLKPLQEPPQLAGPAPASRRCPSPRRNSRTARLQGFGVPSLAAVPPALAAIAEPPQLPLSGPGRQFFATIRRSTHGLSQAPILPYTLRLAERYSVEFG